MFRGSAWDLAERIERERVQARINVWLEVIRAERINGESQPVEPEGYCEFCGSGPECVICRRGLPAA